MAAYYEIVFEDDETDSGEKCFLVTVPAFPEITTYGYNLEEIHINGLNAIEESIAARMFHGEEIPVPIGDVSEVENYVELHVLIILKCGLYSACRGKNITRAELARRLSWHREQVERLFRLDHNSRIDQMEAAFKAIGLPLTVIFDSDAEDASSLYDSGIMKIDIQSILDKTCMTRKTFAEKFGFEYQQLRKWEAGVAQPNRAIGNYLRMIEKNPDIALDIAGSTSS